MIDQLQAIPINGTRQWLLMRGADATKPVLLFVHGGPGSPLMLFSRGFDEELTKHFVVVHWDQRGSGKSYDSQADIEEFSLDQVVEDGLEVVAFLKKRFQKSQITLIGHSWGSIVAAHMTKKRPEDFKLFLSVGTVADMKKGEEEKFKFLHTNEIGPPPWRDFSSIVVLSRLMMKARGSFYSLYEHDINEAVRLTNEYRVEELQGMEQSMQKIWEQIYPFLANYTAIAAMPQIDVPVIFVHGDHDWATPTSLAKEYFEQVKAPKGKKWVSFKQSAHFPMYEESENFLVCLRESV
jgi:pimeloyl-ACP methyl ester carboxylesterase